MICQILVLQIYICLLTIPKCTDRGIQGITDYKQLQTDINNMVTWTMNWCLMFNPTKCKVMSLGHSRIPANYTMLQCDGNILKMKAATWKRI